MKKCWGRFRNSLCLIGTLVSFLYGVTTYAQQASKISTFLSPEGKVFFGDASNSLLIIDYPENMEKIEAYLKMIDQPPTQVLIEARVVEVKLSGEHSLGINWTAFRHAGRLPSFSNFGLSGETTSSPISQAIPFKSTLFPPASAGQPETPFTMTLFNDDMTTIIRTLANSLDTNILSAPRVSVINNHEAEIKIIEELRWAIPSVQVGLGGALSITFAEPSGSPREVGITLKVTPMITDDGKISLDLSPEVSEHVRDLSLSAVVGTTTIPYTIPIVDTRNAKTKVVVGNGQTIIIGGLIKEKVTKEVSKIPLIGDIPYLGYLFKSKRDIHDKSELLIFVSPTIIDSNVEAEMAKKQEGYWYAQEEKKLEKKQTSAATPKEVPQEIRKEASEVTPQETQEVTSQEIPKMTLQELQEKTPQETQEVTPPKTVSSEVNPSEDKNGSAKRQKALAVERALQQFMKDK